MHQHICFVYQAKRISHLGLFPTVIKAEDSKTAFPSEDAATTQTQPLLKTKLCYQFLFAVYCSVTSVSYSEGSQGKKYETAE